MKKLLAVVLLLSSSVALAQAAQSATPVQQTATMANAATSTTCATGTTQQTLTMTPPAGFFVYVTNVDILHSATTAPAATLVTTTTTNLNGMKWYDLMPASVTGVRMNWIASQPLKAAAAGTAVTIVSNAAVTSVTFSLCATYFIAQ